jgi:fatty-acyl-CoA synthase/long-chain acyl-CoA synthetase
MIDWWGPILVEYYGGSEGGSATLINSSEWLEHPGSVGRVMSGTIRITDDNTGRELPSGSIGTVRFDSPARPVRSHLDDDKSRNAYDANGWPTVGDLGYVDEDSYLYLADRMSYTIISGGVNIYPQETEDVLLRHPAIADAAVFGIPDAEYGEQVKAAVELLDPTMAGPEMETALISYCRDHLAAYKCPHSVDFEAQLPRSSAGKLYKRRLRDKYWPADHDLTEKL